MHNDGMPATHRPSALEDHLGFWLRALSNHVHRGFERELARFDVSVPQWVALRRMFDVEAISVTELAAAVGVDQGATSRMVERLIEREWVRREADPSDRRASRLRLTAAGKKLVPRLAEAADRNDRMFFAAITARERTELVRLVKRLVEAHDAPIDANE